MPYLILIVVAPFQTVFPVIKLWRMLTELCLFYENKQKKQKKNAYQENIYKVHSDIVDVLKLLFVFLFFFRKISREFRRKRPAEESKAKQNEMGIDASQKLNQHSALRTDCEFFQQLIK